MRNAFSLISDIEEEKKKKQGVMNVPEAYKKKTAIDLINEVAPIASKPIQSQPLVETKKEESQKQESKGLWQKTGDVLTSLKDKAGNAISTGLSNVGKQIDRANPFTSFKQTLTDEQLKGMGVDPKNLKSETYEKDGILEKIGRVHNETLLLSLEDKYVKLNDLKKNSGEQKKINELEDEIRDIEETLDKPINFLSLIEKEGKVIKYGGERQVGAITSGLTGVAKMPFDVATWFQETVANQREELGKIKGIKEARQRMGTDKTKEEDDVYQLLMKGASKTTGISKNLKKVIEENSTANPTIGESVLSGVASTAPFIVTGGIVAKLGQGGASTIALVNSSLESMQIAGDVYADNREAGKSISESSSNFQKTFLLNFGIGYFTDKLGILNDSGKGKLTKAFMGMTAEGTQEAYQQVIQNVYTDKDPLEGLVESFVIGGVVGLGFSVVMPNGERITITQEDIQTPVEASPQIEDKPIEEDLKKQLEGYLADRTTKFREGTIDPNKISQAVINSFLKDTKSAELKPNRLQEGGVSYQEAKTGEALNGKNLDSRIRIGLDDNGKLVLTDGRHLLEAYRRLDKLIPAKKVLFESAEAETLYKQLLNNSDMTALDNIEQDQSGTDKSYPQDMTKNDKTNYAMSHRPTETGATADEISQTKSEMGYPKDFYEYPERYIDMKRKENLESFNVLSRIRGNPEAEVTIYRASPKNELNKGDWITLSKSYAKGESLTENTPVNSFKVKAKDIQFAGDDINEFGYYPQTDQTQETEKEILTYIEDRTEKFSVKDDIEKLVGKKITDEQEQELISLNKKLFGDSNVTITLQIMANSKALGMYKANMIEILDGQTNPKDTFYHEAVHKYLDVFTTKQEQLEIFKEGIVKYGTNNLSEVEENLAEDFIAYAKNRENLTGKLKSYFESIIFRIKQFLGSGDAIEALYQQILTPVEIKPKQQIEVKIDKAKQPVGTGIIKDSALYKRVQDQLLLSEPDKYDFDEMSGKYNQLNLERDAEKAVSYLEKNPEKAVAVSLGIADAPAGQTANAIGLATALKAKEEKNYVLYAELLNSISLRATRMGQEIVALRGSFNDNSPENFIKRVISNKLDKLGASLVTMAEIGGKKLSQKERVTRKIERDTQNLKKMLSKEQSKIKLAQDIIDSLRC